MLKICEKNKGAISVFLTLILLPTFIFGGVIIDGSRILGAKNIISGAGDLAMNGALSNYHEELNKAYGLLAMASTATEIEDIMQDFFETSLNASGVSKEDFNKALVYLELMDEDFSVSNIIGTEIYETEVLKQEVLEYMKYRAPVTLVNRGINDKLASLKNIEKERKAADTQLKFESELDDMQKLFDELKELTDKQEEIYGKIMTEPQLNGLLESTENTYEDITWLAVAYYRLMHCTDTKEGDVENLMIELADLSAGVSSSVTPSVASILISMQIISNSLSGVDTDSILAGLEKGTEAYEEKLEIIEEYETAEQTLSTGISNVGNKLNSLVNSAFLSMSTQRVLAVEGEINCKEIKEQIQKIKDKFAELEGKYNEWKTAVNNLPEGKTKESYLENIREVSGFFENTGDLAEFEEKIDNNEKFYSGVWNNLDKVTFTGYRVDYEISSKSVFLGEADYGSIRTAGEIESAGKDFMVRYHNIDAMNLENGNMDISDDKFLKQVKEFYCNTENGNKKAAKEKAEEWDNKLADKLEKLEELLTSSDLKDINVWELGKNDLPSIWLGVSAGNADYDKVETEGGLDNSGSRKKMADSGSVNLNKDNASISDMSNLGDMLAQAGEVVAEPLILTEYVCGMFSHYTSNRDSSGKELTSPSLSISRSELNDNALYRAEIEYILWGNQDIRSNVGATKAIIFAINLIFNMSFAFTNREIKADARDIANLFPVGALGKTAIKCVLQSMVALIETTENLIDITEGKQVPLAKSKDTWETWIFRQGGTKDEDTPGFTYEDYIWVLVCIKMFIPSQQVGLLARTADCIELNMTESKSKADNTLKDMFTMVEMEAAVSIDTFFIQKINGAGFNVQEVDEEKFKVQYHGAQGY